MIWSARALILFNTNKLFLILITSPRNLVAPINLKIRVAISLYGNWPRVGKPDTTISAVNSWGRTVWIRCSRACSYSQFIPEGNYRSTILFLFLRVPSTLTAIFFLFSKYILHHITGEKDIKMRYCKAKKLIFVSENSKTLLKLIKNNLFSKSV